MPNKKTGTIYIEVTSSVLRKAVKQKVSRSAYIDKAVLDTILTLFESPELTTWAETSNLKF